MTTNTKIRTEDVLEILDYKIKTSSAHAQLDVISGEFYDSVLAKIAARSPTLDEKGALTNSVSPSASNPFVTRSELSDALSGTIPWRTIGPVGSGSDFEGSDENVFIAAFATVPTNTWFYIQPSVYEFTVPVVVPNGVRVVGSVTSATILASDTGNTLIVGEDTYLAFLTILTSEPTSTALVATSSVYVELKNCIVAAASTGTTVEATDATKLTLIDCALLGTMVGTNASSTMLTGLYVDASGNYGLNLDSPIDLIVWGCTFYAGTPQIVSGTYVRVVGNHFNNGVTNTTPISSVVLRANTPSTNNNEDESLTYLLQYLGSPSALQTTPSYSSNFTGPQAEDLTSRASAIDLCLQWIYEERNFSLLAETKPMTITWNPIAMELTTGNILLVSAHRNAVWKIPAVTTTIQDGWFLYYVIDRSLATSDITLTPMLAPLGSIPIDTNPPTGSPNNRQIYTLAYNLNGTLWWRGGGGSRFPATGGYTGEYFVDGTSKSLLTYLGAEDYNDPHPNYSNNFSGIQGESLTTRLGKIDTLIKRLFENSNLSYYISAGGYISSDTLGVLSLTGTLTFKLPHTTGAITLASNAWTIADGSLLYLTWDQVALGSTTATVATEVPLPDAYPLTTKYFVVAIRVGSFFYLWDGTRLPVGGRWPLPSMGRDVVPTAPATTYLSHYLFTVASSTAAVGATYTQGGNTYTVLATTSAQTMLLCSGTGAPSATVGVLTKASGTGDTSISFTTYTTGYSITNNTAWINLNGVKHFLWENLAVMTSTGIALNRNTLPNQTTPSNGLTDLAINEGLLITHTWNSGLAQNVTVQKVSLPLTSILEQNQFIWVQNRNGYLLFTGEN